MNKRFRINRPSKVSKVLNLNRVVSQLANQGLLELGVVLLKELRTERL